MTTAVKHVGLMTVPLVCLASGAAYYVTNTVMRSRPMPPIGIGGMVVAVVAILALLVLLVFHRRVYHSINTITLQLDTMAETGQIGLIMTDGSSEITAIAKAFNKLLSTTNKHVDEIRATNRQLQVQTRIASAEKQHTEEIIFSISDAVIVTNRFDELMLANEAAEKLLALTPQQYLRKSIDQVISDVTLVRLIRETRNHGRCFTRKVVEHTIEHDGCSRIFNVTLSCIVTPDSEVSGVVAVMHDVTRDKEIARMKTDFVSHVSHELKTPIASIKAYVEMLTDGEAADDKTRNEFYEIIASETDRLHRLIENILDISRIESGVVKVVKEPMDLTSVARQALDVAVPQARAKNIKLADQLAPVFCQVEADRDMIYQAVLNLISNAVKYTTDGGTVNVSVAVDERAGVATFEVADTGVGIPAGDLPHVFDKFYRVKSNCKVAKGTGLGLTLVKHIVETAHDGKLTVTSEPGKGSTFAIERPIIA